MVTQQQIASAPVLNGSRGSRDHLLFTGESFEALDKLGRFVLAHKSLPQNTKLRTSIPEAFKKLLDGTGIAKRTVSGASKKGATVDQGVRRSKLFLIDTSSS
jgi:hypothetical protein